VNEDVYLAWCRRLVVVLVHAGRAEGHITSVLLDSRLGPAAEGLEVTEGGAVVVVGVPQREGLEGRRAAHDGVPLTRAGVDAQRDTLLLALVNHLLQEVHVVGGGRGPVLGALHIEPQHAVLGGANGAVGLRRAGEVHVVVGQVTNSVIHLQRNRRRREN